MDAQFNGPTPMHAQATQASEGSSDLADQASRLELGGD
jgi:hypothetical protein